MLDFEAISQNEKLIYIDPDAQETRKQVTFAFGLMGYATLVLLALTLPFKTVGLELLVCLQIVYLSTVLYFKPCYISTLIQSLQPVTGYRNLFCPKNYVLMPWPYAKMLNLCPQYLENNFPWLGLLIPLLLLVTGLEVYHFLERKW